MIEKNLIEEALSENLIREDVDGEVLLGMTVEQLISHVGYSFGKAMRLLNWLKKNTEIPVAGPVVPHVITKESEPMGVKKIGNKEHVSVNKEKHKGSVEHMISSAVHMGQSRLSQISGNSLDRARAKKLLPAARLPSDPVADIVDLTSRVFDKKPPGEYSNMWGKGYHETYHPRAHATYKRNVDQMRGFFF